MSAGGIDLKKKRKKRVNILSKYILVSIIKKKKLNIYTILQHCSFVFKIENIAVCFALINNS